MLSTLYSLLLTLPLQRIPKNVLKGLMMVMAMQIGMTMRKLVELLQPPMVDGMNK
jgi:hypothetical protein